MIEVKRAIRDRPIKVDEQLKVVWNDNAPEIYEEVVSDTPVINNKKEVVVPGVTVHQNYLEETPPNFKLPGEYIHYRDRNELDYDDVVEYDMDSDDERFLSEMERKTWSKQKHHNFTLTPDIFELVIDHLEKESYKQKEFSQLLLEHENKPTVIDHEDEDDIPCCVCNERDYDDSNLIVFCDGCDIAVHQECQGLKEIPSGSWLCDRCASSDDDQTPTKNRSKKKAQKKK